MPEFDWDANKSAANKKKHGVSFKEATEIWSSVHITVSNLARSQDGEKRGATIGIIGSRLYTAIWTKRKDKLRLISVRSARDGEKRIYRKKTL